MRKVAEVMRKVAEVMRNVAGVMRKVVEVMLLVRMGRGRKKSYTNATSVTLHPLGQII